MKIKLYYARGSGSLASRILIHELNLDCDFIAVNKKSFMTELRENFLNINPKGRLPTLINEAGMVITENQVIQQYLADQYGSPKGILNLLPPVTNIQRYQILEWVSFMRIDLQNNYTMFMNQEIPNEFKQQYLIPNMKKKLMYPEDFLQNRDFLVGNNFSIADGSFFVILDWLKEMNINILDYPNLEKYYLKLKKRPSIQLSLKEKNLI